MEEISLFTEDFSYSKNEQENRNEVSRNSDGLHYQIRKIRTDNAAVILNRAIRKGRERGIPSIEGTQSNGEINASQYREDADNHTYFAMLAALAADVATA
jgi:hypothetical protein